MEAFKFGLVDWRACAAFSDCISASQSSPECLKTPGECFTNSNTILLSEILSHWSGEGRAQASVILLF